ncbi:MAG: sigma-70 family RNA polymerase sigma factor [Acidobacteriota bacterium]|jgi:RNA polymerase sigma-70 factor (ECF subfamily)
MTGGEVTCGSDDNLALAVHRNENGAVERLVKIYQNRLFSYALRLLQDPFDAQEVTQDAFLRACHALTRRYDEKKCGDLVLAPWLFRITRNLAYSRSSKRRSRNEVPLPGKGVGGDEIPSNPDEGIRELESRGERQALRTALRSLGLEERELVLLRFLEEMSYAEMASIIGGTDASVRGKVFRALRKLRASIEKNRRQKCAVRQS